MTARNNKDNNNRNHCNPRDKKIIYLLIMIRNILNFLEKEKYDEKNKTNAVLLPHSLENPIIKIFFKILIFN